jgi:F-type H+-transporting ATPase subunit gamma
MAALKDVRLRIKAVGGIRQITKAMKMVATVKMKRVQDTLVSVRPYTDSVYEMAVRLAAAADEGATANPFLRAGSTGPEAVLVIGSDRGLCGSFNNNLFRFVDAHYGAGSNTAYILVGKKARDYYRRRGKEITKTYEKLVFPFKWESAEVISRDMLSLFSFGGFSRVSIAYQQFISTGRMKPKIVAWLPFRTADSKAKGGPSGVSCEPTTAEVLDAVLPRALAAQLYRAVLEAQASEESARMMAMENATNNATDLIRNLTLLANRLRQGGITKELLEITSGSEALKA